ncbi:hypothetical protein BCR41DRAFT_390512 [Lobosporangium transversale]|uniref:Crinkler effector protein N-terminal domain-containing protein n=1 Tax=Lobosporangium transversale TaxID=64571 RepID=A0A1Y2G6U8_9FUNG|nr:hypothetical protein BCR41DRAFT_390512 [Lobosporangium transversale]ORY98441.1 hypothetical protein BCR41DRAFT_390512 [Lobosporangium transversale]|eukprot:XP_021875812.1 hypothetical protein BCR41DRAFT_390512 [Lobosporangium transversale]
MTKLFCILDGNSTPFSVVVSPDDTVDDLKKAIKKEKENDFREIDADKLNLFHVSVPDEGATINLANIESKELLTRATSKISKIFGISPLPEETINVIIQRPSQGSFAGPRALELNDEDERLWLERIKKEFFQGKVKQFLESYANGDLKLPLTGGVVSGLPKVPRRGTPSEKKEWPSLLLLSPSTSLNNTIYHPCEEAIKKIYEDDPRQLSLFGVSGCGKTRTVIEILSQKWGIYLNASSTDRGSNDLTSLAKFMQEANLERLYNNQDKAENGLNTQAITHCLLLSRLLIFQHCLGLNKNLTCESLMLLQVCPSAFSKEVPDIFDKLFNTIAASFHRGGVGRGNVCRVVQKAFEQVQSQLNPSTKILIVVDEAQNFSRVFEKRFQSNLPDSRPRPLLSPVVHGLETVTTDSQHVCIIPCGTGLSLNDLQWLEDSGAEAKGTKEPDGGQSYRITNFSGWSSIAQITEYLERLKDQVTTGREKIDEMIPPAAVDTMYRLLRGRFRPIISVIEGTIWKHNAIEETKREQNEPGSQEEPIWMKEIKDVQQRLTTCPDDLNQRKRGNLCSDFHHAMKALNVEKSEMLYLVKVALVRMVLFGVQTVIAKELPQLVESALGRMEFIKSKSPEYRTVIDEPFVFLAVHNYFQKSDPGFHNMIVTFWTFTKDPKIHGKFWECQVPLSLINIFHNKTLAKKMFPKNAPLDLVDHEATIVGWKKSRIGADCSDLTMEQFLEAHFDHDSRIDKREIPPFYFPTDEITGPDIVFILKINKKMYPVFVQLKFVKKLDGMKAAHALETISRDAINVHHLPNFDRFCPPNERYLSLLLMYPGKLSDKNKTMHPPDSRQALMVIDEGNIAEYFHENEIELLDSIKRSGEAIEHGREKKIKSNEQESSLTLQDGD